MILSAIELRSRYNPFAFTPQHIYVTVTNVVTFVFFYI